MNVEHATIGEVMVFAIEGNLDTATSPDAEKYIIDILDSGEFTKVVISLKNTDYVSSSGLRVFLVVAKRLQQVGGRLRLCDANSVVDEVLTISGFKKILDVQEDRATALRGLGCP